MILILSFIELPISRDNAYFLSLCILHVRTGSMTKALESAFTLVALDITSAANKGGFRISSLSLWHGSSRENIKSRPSAHRCELETSLAFHAADTGHQGALVYALSFFVSTFPPTPFFYPGEIISNMKLKMPHFASPRSSIAPDFKTSLRAHSKGSRLPQSLTQHWISLPLFYFFFYYHFSFFL